MSCHCLVESASVSRVLYQKGDLQSERPTACLLHEFVDVLRLEIVLEECIVEELPLDLGNLDPGRSLRIQLQLQLLPTRDMTLGVAFAVALFVAILVTLLVTLLVALVSVMGEIVNCGGFGRGALRIRNLLEEAGGGWVRGDNRGAVFGSGSIVLGWFVAGDGGDALSSEPHLGRLGTVYHIVGVRIDEPGVEDASRGEGQFPHVWMIRDVGHLAKIKEE